MYSPQQKRPLGSANPNGADFTAHAHRTPSAREVKARAYGQWLPILSALAHRFEAAIDRLGHHVPCPVHGGKDGFRMFRDAAETGGGCCNTCGTFADGLALLMWANGWTFHVALQEVAAWLGMGGSTSDQPVPHQVHPVDQEPKRDPKRAAALNRIWIDSVEMDDPMAKPALTYLASRGLAGIPMDPKALLFHPRLKFVPEDGGPARYLPGIVARIVNVEGVGMGLHRTFLTADGTKVGRKKMPAIYDGATRGGAIRLFPATHRLMVGEGIENCLAAWLQTHGEWPVWSAVDAGGLAALQLPPSIREVVIAADNDASRTGQDAAATLAGRLRFEGRKVTISLPPNEGQDWADVLLATAGQEVVHG